jgi:hypothetical protein
VKFTDSVNMNARSRAIKISRAGPDEGCLGRGFSSGYPGQFARANILNRCSGYQPSSTALYPVVSITREARPDQLAALLQPRVVGLKKHYCQHVLRFCSMAVGDGLG